MKLQFFLEWQLSISTVFFCCSTSRIKRGPPTVHKFFGALFSWKGSCWGLLKKRKKSTCLFKTICRQLKLWVFQVKSIKSPSSNAWVSNTRCRGTNFCSKIEFGHNFVGEQILGSKNQFFRSKFRFSFLGSWPKIKIFAILGSKSGWRKLNF